MSAPREEVSELALARDDKDLVLAFKRGEDGSYQAIHDRYRTRVQGICRRMLDQPQDAEEAAQETFVRVFTALPTFNGRYQLGAWMSRIATNVCLDHLRSRTRRPSDCVAPEVMADLPGASEEDGPEELMIAAADRKRVRSVLEGLAPMHRAAIALREFEGMSYSDIAVALGITEPQVKALLHRARKSFKRSWGPAGLAALLPWRLVMRMKRAAMPAQEVHGQVADVAASTMSVANSCAVALQHCGHFVTERVATAVTALVIGGAAVGVAVAPSSDPEPHDPPPARISSVTAAAPDVDRDAKKTARKRPAVVAAEPDPIPAEPAPEPAPTTEPAPEQSPPAPQPTTAPPKDNTTKPPAPTGPPPLYTYFGWVGDSEIPRAQATSSTSKVDCGLRDVTHRVESLISYGSFSYRTVFDFFVDSNSARMQFTVVKDNSSIPYTSWGAAPGITWSKDGARDVVEITGEYGASNGYHPEQAGLPGSGGFHAVLTLDCAAQTVITEGTELTQD